MNEWCTGLISMERVRLCWRCDAPIIRAAGGGARDWPADTPHGCTPDDIPRSEVAHP